MAQRFLDIILVCLALIILSPLFAVVIVVLSITGEKEVFFRQTRVGKNGNRFSLLKFATMLKDSPNMNTGSVTIKNDPRVLPFGKFLRKTKINELPQLINILSGEIGLIGPRPLTEETFKMYSFEVQTQIMKVRPGLSGIGSIVFRDEEEILTGDYANTETYQSFIAPYKGELEVWYAHNHNFTIYSLAIFVTVWSVIWPRSSLVWDVFPTLPSPPAELKDKLNYPL